LSQYATNGAAIDLYRPVSGTAAVGNAEEVLPLVGDFFGNFRPAYPSQGALEAD